MNKKKNVRSLIFLRNNIMDLNIYLLENKLESVNVGQVVE